MSAKVKRAMLKSVDVPPVAPGDEPSGWTNESNEVDLAEMNNQYAVVKIGGKTRVMSLEESPIFPGCKVPVFSTIQDFCAFNLKRKKTLSDGIASRDVGIGRWWINHPERRQYDGVVYAPDEKIPNLFNLWTGFSCEPVPGD